MNFFGRVSYGVLLCTLGVTGVSLHAEPLPATEVKAQPLPLPGVGEEVRKSSRLRETVKHGFHRRSGRSQSYPVRLSQQRLNTSPFYFAGYLSFLKGGRPYQGSGTVVRKRSVLTCAHVLWNSTSGWSSNLRFYRARYGAGSLGAFSPNRIFIHGNYIPNANSYGTGSSYTFAYDIGWMTFRSPVARGGYSGFAKNYGALTGTNPCVAVGYGGGTYPKYSEPARSYARWNGTAYFTNRSYDHEGGMSGGPIFATIKGKRYVNAVIVSSGGGVRAIDSYVYSRLLSLP